MTGEAMPFGMEMFFLKIIAELLYFSANTPRNYSGMMPVVTAVIMQRMEKPHTYKKEAFR